MIVHQHVPDTRRIADEVHGGRAQPQADQPAIVACSANQVAEGVARERWDDTDEGIAARAWDYNVQAKAGYAKFNHPASRFALTGVFVARTPGGDVRVAATGASQNGVMRVSAIEAALKANWSAGAIDSVKISADGLMSDIHGTSDYRANLIKVMAQRAVTAAG